jgi:hypothetical protein
MGLKLKHAQLITTARPDDRGRITLGSTLTKDVSRYDVFLDEATGEVLLKPFKEIPAQEAWFYKNETAQDLVTNGLIAAKSGKLKKIDLKKSIWIDDVEDDE